LNVTNVSGCFGLINEGDQWWIQLVFAVTSPAGSLTITES
jgi:hypothetical protein